MPEQSLTSPDLGDLPAIMTSKQLAPVVHTTPDRLANDRYHERGLPYIKYGARVFYLRSDVIAFLEANRRIPGDH